MKRNKMEMSKLFNVFSVVLGIAGGIATRIVGGWDKALWALVVIMCLDYITGIMKAVYTKRVSSAIGYKGLIKKIIILVIVALANIIENITGGAAAMREMVIMFYIVNEAISVLENAAVITPNMPKKLKDILLQIRGNEDDNRD